MKNYKTNNKLKKITLILFCIFLTTRVQNNINFVANATTLKDEVKTKNLTTKKYILGKIKNDKKTKKEEIVKKYYKLSQAKKKQILDNDRMIKKQNKPENLNATKKELKKIKEVEKLIKKKEAQYVRKFIDLPEENNQKNPIVILNPGHGFEDPGATIKTQKYGEILEKTLNANLCTMLTKYLLKQGFEVYLPFKPENANFEKEEENSSLHILFEKRPPIKGEGNLQRVADASAFCIRQIFTKLNEEIKGAKIASICIHHNSAANEKACGIISFYGNVEERINKESIKKSKKLSEILFKYCKKIYINKIKNKQDCGGVKGDDFAVCLNRKKANGAAVLTESGFITNKEELDKIMSKKENKKMCKALTKGLCEYFGVKYKQNKK